MTIKAANELVTMWHRHHRPVVGALFAVGLELDGRLVGAAIVGRPKARMDDDGFTAEVVRIVTDGTHNAVSKLTSACRRAAIHLGYRKLLTFTLESESGVSMRASGWLFDGMTGGGSWSRPSRERTDKHPIVRKRRWKLLLAAGECE